MSQLRWSLLILGLAFIAALAWWEWRRPRQGRAPAELRPVPRAPAAETSVPRVPREPPLELPEIHARSPLAGDELPVLELPGDPLDVPGLGAAARAPMAEHAELPAEAAESLIGELPVDLVADLPRDVGTDVGDDVAGDTLDNVTADVAIDAPGDALEANDAVEEGVPPPERPDPPLSELPPIELEAGVVAAPRELPREKLPELPAAPAPLVEWPPDTERRVVALRLVATQPARFAGRSLRQALAAEGFVLGKFAIFHKPDDEQRAVLSAASLTRPGTFDAQTMDSQHYGGLSLFAVVPGPRTLPDTFEELVATARSLNQRLQGALQDEAGSPLTPARIAILREHLGRETPA